MIISQVNQKGRWAICLIIILSLFIIPQSVRSEPTPAFQYLMNEPVSMMDWGLYQLGNLIDGQSINWKMQDEKPLLTYVKYNWDLNKIQIFIEYGLVIGSGIEKKKIKDSIIEIIDKIRNLLTGKHHNIDPNDSSLAYQFKHDGYASKKRVKNLGRKLCQNTEIIIQVLKATVRPMPGTPSKTITTINYSEKPYLECHAPLLGKEIFWKETEKK